MRKLLNRIVDGAYRLWGKIVEFPYAAVARSIISWIGRVLHKLLFGLLLPKKWRGITKKQIYEIIFKADTPAGKKFDVWLLVLILLNILVLIIDSMMGETNTLKSNIRHSDWSWIIMKVLEWGFTIIFTFEYYLRIYCLKRPMKYVLSFWGIIDFLSIFPAYLSLIFPATQALSVLRLLRTLRIFRIFKLRKFQEEGWRLLSALRRSAVKIIIFMMFVFIVAIILGTLMYAIEGEQNEAISSIPRGIYWAVVTLTTVGYGDIAPITPTGQFISMIVMMLGYSIIAVPTGIVAGETLEEHRRDRESRRGRRFQSEEDNLQPKEDYRQRNNNNTPLS